MLATNKAKAPVKAILKVGMIVDGEPRERGDRVELKARDFAYLANMDRVAEATKDNVEELLAIVKQEKIDAAELAAARVEEADLKSQLAAARAEIAQLRKK